jgi:tryptophan halogenase
MNHTDNINRIVIVGGGTAGWLVAAYLRRRTGCTITLMESSDIGTIGVGEATIPSLVDLLRNLKLDEDEFMRRCHATYKLGIKFVNWIHQEHVYWHPFGLCGGLIDGIDLFHFWLKRVRTDCSDEPYSFYCLQALLAEAGKAHRPIDGASVVANYAYHLDASAFADYLKYLATTEGVYHVVDTVRHVVLDERGFIERLETASGHAWSADFYVDCTGFRGLLIEQALGDPWIDWSHLLLCDRAVVLRLPADENMPPYTRSTAVDAGWIWQIPLSNRTGCGYVYSSAHTPDDGAARALLGYANQEERSAADLHYLTMRVGRRQHFWKRNCLSVGLASGFIEPLESTGIFFIQRALDELIACFPDTRFNEALARTYNQRLADVYDEVRDFVILHYVLTQREDTSFWHDSRNIPVPDSLRARRDFYQANGFVIEAARDPVFGETNFYHILAGGACLPCRPLPRADFSNFAAVCRLLDQIRARNQKIAETLPTHRALMAWLHGPRPCPAFQ